MYGNILHKTDTLILYDEIYYISVLRKGTNNQAVFKISTQYYSFHQIKDALIEYKSKV